MVRPLADGGGAARKAVFTVASGTTPAGSTGWSEPLRTFISTPIDGRPDCSGRAPVPQSALGVRHPEPLDREEYRLFQSPTKALTREFLSTRRVGGTPRRCGPKTHGWHARIVSVQGHTPDYGPPINDQLGAGTYDDAGRSNPDGRRKRDDARGWC